MTTCTALGGLVLCQYFIAPVVATEKISLLIKNPAYKQFPIPAQDAFRNEDYETAERLLKQFEQSDYRFDPEEIGPCGEEGNFQQLKELLKIARQCRADGVPRKHWKDFDTAKKEVSAILRRGTLNELSEYVVCFPRNTMTFEWFCAFDDLMNGAKGISNLSDNLRLKPALFTFAEWRSLGRYWAFYPRTRDQLNCDATMKGSAPLVVLGFNKRRQVVVTDYAVCEVPNVSYKDSGGGLDVEI